MWARRRGRKVAQIRTSNETEAALALASQHADAGWKAQSNGSNYAWAPPGGSPATPEPPHTTPVPVQAATDASPALELQTELLRVLDVVTNMCENVLSYIEADRAERQLLVDTLAEVARSFRVIEVAPTPAVVEPHEHVIGGSVDAGPETFIDLGEGDPHWSPL